MKNIKTAWVGLVLTSVGFLSIFDLFHSQQRRVLPPMLSWLIFLGPTILIAGLVILFRGLIRGRKILSRHTVLYTGLAMLLAGGYPWIYTPLIIRDRGMEGSGMLGTLIFLLIGLPGLILSILGFLIRD